MASRRKRPATEGLVTAPRAKKRSTMVSKQKPFNLQGLPGDILDVIAHDYLDSLDFFNLRLACRDLHKNTSKAFGRRYFKHVKFMLSPDSLQALEDISKNEELSQFIRHVGIGTERIHSNILSLWEVQYCAEWAQRYGEEYNRQLRRQEHIEQDGADVQILTKVLKSLPNLQSVGVGGPRTADKGAQRIWDVEHMQPWGIEELFRKLGVLETRQETLTRERTVNYGYSYLLIPSRHGMLNDETTHTHTGTHHRVFEIVFKVLQEVGRDLRLDFHLLEPHEHHDMPFSLADPNAQAALSRTRCLTVDFAYTDRPHVQQQATHLAFDAWLNQLIPQTTSMASFQMSSCWGQHGTHRKKLDYIFNRFASGRFLKLRVLKLEHVNVDVDIFLSLLTALSSTLNTISLYGMTITNEPPNPSTRDDNDYAQRNKWVDVCHLLRSMQNLQSVTLCSLMEYRGPSHPPTSNSESSAKAVRAALNGLGSRYAWLPPGVRYRDVEEVKTLELRGRREVVDGLGQVVQDQWYAGLPHHIGGVEYVRIRFRVLAVEGRG